VPVVNRGVPLGTVAGVRIRAHWSVLFIAGLIAWGVGGTVIPAVAPETNPVAAWSIGVLTAVLLIASLTAHELAHALVAKQRGIEVEGITLWLFGGMAQISSDWAHPNSEMLVAAAGPAVTLVLALFFTALAYVFAVLGAPPLAVVVPEWLATVNVVLLVFNLVPAFPLDGGRILRGVLWRFTNNRLAATRLAARGGRLFAYLLVIGGFVELFATSSVQGLWLVLIGWFLANASRSEERGERARHALEGVHVADVMSRDPLAVPSWITVELLIDQYVLGHDFTSFPTHNIDGTIEGLVTLQAIRRVAPNRRSKTRARDIALPLNQVPRAEPDELVTDLLKRLGPGSNGRALVFDGDQLVGIVSPSDLARLLHAGGDRARRRTAA
jgi:Zn-dependent protease